MPGLDLCPYLHTGPILSRAGRPPRRTVLRRSALKQIPQDRLFREVAGNGNFERAEFFHFQISRASKSQPDVHGFFLRIPVEIVTGMPTISAPEVDHYKPQKGRSTTRSVF